jgi:uncharacterized Tic20 family protein
MNNNLTVEERHVGNVYTFGLLWEGFVIPFGNIIGPLVLWQIKKDQSTYL